MSALVKVKPATIVPPDASTTLMAPGADVPYPPEWDKVAEPHVNDRLNVNPTVEFTEPGDYVNGRFEGVRELSIKTSKGPRQQIIYDLRTQREATMPNGSKSVIVEVVSVWGSTILDRRFQEEIKKGLAPGKALTIQYLGEIDTGQPSAAKNFRLIWK
jgi:hypothetical protein